MPLLSETLRLRLHLQLLLLKYELKRLRLWVLLFLLGALRLFAQKSVKFIVWLPIVHFASNDMVREPGYFVGQNILRAWRIVVFIRP